MIGSSPSIEGEGFTCSRSEPKALPIPAKAAVGMTGTHGVVGSGSV